MIAKRGGDWRTILVGMASLCGALAAFILAAVIILYAALGPTGNNGLQNGQTPFQVTIIASGILCIGVVFLPSVYYGIQRWRGQEIPPTAPQLLKVWQGFLLVLLWAGAAWLAQLWLDNDILKWFTPLLYVLAIGTPVYFLVRLASGGLNTGSRQRLWGVLTTSIALGVSLSIVVETMMMIFGLIVLIGYLALHPDLLAAFKQITDQISNASSIDAAMNALDPLLNSPLAFVLALIFFSGLAPLIEETCKSLAAWTLFDRLASPAQGFVIGALSGAGFGLFESLMASATPDSSWASTLMVRGGSTMMHIMAASLTGWGIGFFHNANPGIGRTLRLLAMYALAMSMHGLWNASVIMIVFGNLRVPDPAGNPDLLGKVLEYTGAGVLVILCIAIPLSLGIINRRFRRAATPPPTPPAEGLPNLTAADGNEEPKDGGTIPA